MEICSKTNTVFQIFLYLQDILKMRTFRIKLNNEFSIMTQFFYLSVDFIEPKSNIISTFYILSGAKFSF